MRVLVSTYLVLTLIMATDLSLFLTKDISLPGHLLDWLLFWTWLIMTLAVILSNLKKKWARLYTTALVVFTILTMLPMMIPFVTILAFAVSPENQRYRVSNDMELQEFQRSAIGIPTIVNIRSFGFYERIVGQTEFEIQVGDEFYRLEDAKSIRKLDSDGGDSLKIEFTFEGGKVVKTL